MGKKSFVEPAIDDFKKLSYKILNDYDHIILELNLKDFVSFSPKKGKIDTVKESEANQIADLRRYLHDPDNKNPLSQEEIQRAKIKSENFCIKINDKIVSTASTPGLGNDYFIITEVITNPEYRNLCLAKATCSALIKHMQKIGAKKAVVFTSRDNEIAKALYQQLGFKIIDDWIFAILKRS